MKAWWKLFCLKWRYLMREPYDVEANRALADEITKATGN